MMVYDKDKNIWAHLTCVNWLKDVWFSDEDKTKIDGKINLPEHEALRCSICCLKNAGACIQCDYKDCTRAFHVRCAIREKLIRDWESMDD